MQIAPDAEAHRAGLARHHGVPDIVARIRWNRQRQIAVHPGAIGALQAAAEVQHPRKTRPAARARRIAGVPRGTRLPLRIGVGKAGVGHLHGDALAIDLPAHRAAELVQRQHRVFKNAGQYQRTMDHVHGGLASLVRQIEVHGGSAHADGLCGGRIVLHRARV